MKIGTCQAKKEHLSKGELVVAVDAQSNPIAIPILIATGSTDGKTIFLSAGVHGDEINSLEILQRFINNLDVTALAGTIIFLPLINVSGFKAKDRCVQYDGKDLNRCFPGDDKGTVSVRAKPLSPEQAIGRPKRKDFPIIKGKEVMIQAEFREHFGQAFTDNPGDFQGSLQDVLNLSLEDNFHRAIFVSTLNAVMRYSGLSEGTQHCKDDAPEKCAEELAEKILREYGNIKVGLIGYQPAMLEYLANTLGAGNLKATDLDAERIGTTKHGVEIWDGEKDTETLIQQSDLVLATGSTIVNSSTDEILKLVKQHDKEYILFGCTIAGIASLLGLKQYCPYGG